MVIHESEGVDVGSVQVSMRPGPNEHGQEAILVAAAEAFMRSGYNGTSIDDIADLLASTKGRIYHYFRSKADIYLAIVSTIISDMLEEISAIAESEGTPTDRLFRMAHRHVRLLQARPAFSRVALMHTEGYVVSGLRQEDAQNQIAAIRSDYEARFRDVVAEGVEAGEFREVDVRLATKPLLGALNWLALWYRDDVDESDAEHVAAELATFVVHGLRQGLA